MMTRKIIMSIVLVVSVIYGCNEDVLDQLNPNNLTPESYFKTIDELRAGVNAGYSMAQSSSLVAREYFFLHDLRSDEMASGGGQLETPRNQLLIGTHDAGNSVMNAIWNGFYRMIHRVNTVIVAGDAAEGLPAAEKNAVIAEARFLRGWAYFELGTLWGGVPIYTAPATSPNATAPRSTLEETFSLAEQDLEFAADNLPATWDGSNLGRATKGAALAMLARLHLQQDDYASAKTALDELVGLGIYELVDDYYDNFTEEAEFNSESIFEIGYSTIGGFNWNGDGDGVGNEHTVRSQEYSAVGWRNVIPGTKLLEAHERIAAGDEKEDPRLRMNAIFTGDTFANGTAVLTAEAQRGNSTLFEGEQQKISWLKWSVMYKQDPGGFTLSGINQRLIRYAEVLLMLAEIENELNNNQQAALNYVNQIRERVDMPPMPTANWPGSTQAEVRRIIQHEKYIELAGEQVRNRDLLRWRKYGKLDREPLSYFVPNRHELLPIPQSEINNNPLLTEADQNPGY